MSDRDKMLQLKKTIKAIANNSWPPETADWCVVNAPPSVYGLTWEEIGTAFEKQIDYIEALESECDQLEAAQEARDKRARNEQLEEAIERCKLILATGVCAAGTEYENGHEAAAKRCIEELEALIAED